ncbi:MAG: divalent-cation tolerance protein CutA [Novosphingobium sp.]
MTGGCDDREPALIWCPFPDRASAEEAAGALLDEGLVACANIIPAVISLYVWRGARERGEETGVLFKTSAAVLSRAIDRLAELHPYDEPAVLGWRCDAAAPATAGWLATIGQG